MTDLAPAPLRERLPPPRGRRATPWLTVVGSVVVSIVLGAYTHALWDTFTHANRLGSQWLPVLNASIGPLPLFKWLQYGSGVLGLVVLGWWLVRWWRRTPARPVPALASPALRRLCWLAVTGALALGGGAVMVLGLGQGLSWERVAYLGVTRGGAAAMIAVGVGCACWWITARRTPTEAEGVRTR